MAGRIRSGGRFYVAGSSDEPANGWKVYTFTAGSAGVVGTDDKETFTDYTLATPQTNPIILDSRGEAEVWWIGTYLIKIYDADDNLIYTMDFFGAGEDAEFDAAIPPLNGSFEVDDNGDGVPNNWTISENAGATIAIDDTDAIHGSNSLKFTSTAATGGGTATSDKFAVRETHLHILYFSVKASAANSSNKIEVKWFNLADTLISTATLWSNTTTNPLVWTETRQALVVPTNAVKAQLVITGMDATGTTKIGNVKFDDVRFEESSIERVALANTVNWLQAGGNTTGNNPTLEARGESNIGLTFKDSNNNFLIKLFSVANAVNLTQFINAATGNFPVIQAEGEANVGLIFRDSNNATCFVIQPLANAANRVDVYPALTGNAPRVEPEGADTHIALKLAGKGDGGPYGIMNDLGTIATTSGASHSWTIPTVLQGNIRRVTLVFDEVSLAGAAAFGIRLGDSTGVYTTGYRSTEFLQTSTPSTIFNAITTWLINCQIGVGAELFTGEAIIYNVTGNVWAAVFSAVENVTGTSNFAFASGRRSLTNTLTTIQIAVPSGSFDAGQVTCFVEG